MTGPNETEIEDKGLQESDAGGSVPGAEAPPGDADAAPPEETNDEPGPDESGEQGEESEVPDGGESEEELKVPTPEGEEADDDSEEDPLLALKRRADEQAALNLKLVDLLSQRQEKAKPKADDFADVPDDLMRIALFGGATEQIMSRFTPVQVERARTAAEAHAARQIRYVRNPAAMLEDLKDRVTELVSQRVRPIEDDYTQRRANDLASRYFTKHDKNVQERIRTTFNTMPGSNGDDWKTIEANLKLAEKLALLETQSKGSKADSQKKTAKKVQQIAAGGGKLRGTQTAKGNGSSPSARPTKKDDETYEQFGRRLAKFYQAGGQ